MVGYEDTQVESMKMILSQMKVQGVEQARLLVMMDNIIKSGKKLEENEEEKEENR